MRVRTFCNDCGDRDQFHTQAEAFFHMELHELDHDGAYVWQQFCNDKGWQNFRAPVWGKVVN